MTPEEALEQTRVMMLSALEHAFRFDNAMLHRVASAWLATYATRDGAAVDLSRETYDINLDQALRLVLSATGPYVATDPNASASPPGMPTAYPACPDCYHPDVNHYAKRDGARRCSLCLDWGVGAHDKSGPGSPRHFAPEEPQPRPPGRKHG